jgi:hypothetical protein
MHDRTYERLRDERLRARNVHQDNVQMLSVDIRPEAPREIEVELPGGGNPERVVINDGV